MNDFLKSRVGVVLLAFLVIGGFLLAFEHRAHIFTGNGIIIALLAVCIGMHLFMHGGHGSHGGGHGHKGHDKPDPRDEDREKR